MKYYKEYQVNKEPGLDESAELSNSSDEIVLDDTALEEVSGGITPIPIPYVAINATTLKQSLKNYQSSKEFEGGGGIG